jgi:hypothetical protein
LAWVWSKLTTRKTGHAGSKQAGTDEGEVTLSHPAELSPESHQDMGIGILLRGLKWRADAKAARRRLDRDELPE